jgi:hypothetical protein
MINKNQLVYTGSNGFIDPLAYGLETRNSVTIGVAGSNAMFTRDKYANDKLLFEAAFAYALANGNGIVKILTGTYNTFPASNNITISNPNIIVEGEGDSTKLVFPTLSTLVFTGSNVVLRNLYIDASGQTNLNDYGVKFDNAQSVLIDSLNGIFGSYGIFMGTGISGGATYTDYRITNCNMIGLGRNDVIGGGVYNDASIMKNIVLKNNYIRTRLVQPGDTVTGGTVPAGYTAAINIVKANSFIFDGNIVSGGVYLGVERFPNSKTIITNNILSPAENKTEVTLETTTRSDATTGNTDIKINGNLITQGKIVCYGVDLALVDRVEITQNTISNNGTTVGNKCLELRKVKGGLVALNVLSAANNALEITDTNNTIFANNKISDSSTGIIDFSASDTNSFIGNTTENVTNPLLTTSTGATIIGNTTKQNQFANRSVFSGGMSQKIEPVAKAGNYTLNSSTDQHIFFDCTGADRIATLPAAAANRGTEFYITKIDSSVNVILLTPQATEEVNQNTAALSLPTRWKQVRVQCDGVRWWASI